VHEVGGGGVSAALTKVLKVSERSMSDSDLKKSDSNKDPI
jgi:hypothetical protein